MARDSNGNFGLAAGNPVAANTVIQPAWANTTLSDVAAALTDSLSRSGAGKMLAPLGAVSGTVSLPGLAFLDELNSGLYRAGANDIRLSVAGVDRLKVTPTALTATFATTTLTGNLVAVGGTFSGNVSGVNGTFSGPVSGTTGTFSSAVSGTTGTFSSTVSGVAGTFSGAVSGTTGTFSSTVSGVAGTFSGALSGTTGTFSSTVSGTTGTFTGLVSPTLTSTALTISASSTSITMTAPTNIILDAESITAIRHIGFSTNAIQVSASQTLLNYTGASTPALNIINTSLSFRYQSPADSIAFGISNSGVALYTPGYQANAAIEMNDTQTKIRFPNTAEAAILTNSTTLNLYNNVAEVRLVIATNMSFPNIPTSNAGLSTGMVYRDGAGADAVLKIK